MANNKKWKLLDKKPVFESKWMTIEDRSYELPDGKKVNGYYHLIRPDYVLILAVDNENQIVIERQYRRGVDDFVYELPAGWIEEGESPLDTAVRELKEETGLIGKGIWSQEIYAQPSFTSMKAHVCLVEIQGSGNHSQHPDENIEYELMSLNQIKHMIKDGKIKDMGMLSALGLYLEKIS